MSPHWLKTNDSILQRDIAINDSTWSLRPLDIRLSEIRRIRLPCLPRRSNFKTKRVLSDLIPSIFCTLSYWILMVGLDHKHLLVWLTHHVCQLPIIGCFANLHSIAYTLTPNDKLTLLFKRKERATVWHWNGCDNSFSSLNWCTSYMSRLVASTKQVHSILSIQAATHILAVMVCMHNCELTWSLDFRPYQPIQGTFLIEISLSSYCQLIFERYWIQLTSFLDLWQNFRVVYELIFVPRLSGFVSCKDLCVKFRLRFLFIQFALHKSKDDNLLSSTEWSKID